MSMTTKRFVKGDTLVSLYATLTDYAGNAINLTDHTVAFTMEDHNGVNKVSGSNASIVDANNGTVRYDWNANDVDTEGLFFGYFVRTNANRTAHHPVKREFQILFEPRP